MISALSGIYVINSHETLTSLPCRMYSAIIPRVTNKFCGGLILVIKWHPILLDLSSSVTIVEHIHCIYIVIVFKSRAFVATMS